MTVELVLVRNAHKRRKEASSPAVAIVGPRTIANETFLSNAEIVGQHGEHDTVFKAFGTQPAVRS